MCYMYKIRQFKSFRVLLLCATLFMSWIGVAQAELSANANISSSYLFRGSELGSGTPLFSGEISYEFRGIYGTAWIASGDDSLGTEVDLLVGYNFNWRDLFAEVGVISYLYPSGGTQNTQAIIRQRNVRDLGELSEFYIGASISFIEAYYYDNISGDSDYSYFSLAGSISDSARVVLGYHSNAASSKDNYGHVDVTYAFNDSLSFTVSRRFNEGDNARLGYNDTIYVATYTFPLASP